MLEGSSISLCLDTGHPLIGGTDPAELDPAVPHRIAHTHMKDVDLSLARQVQSGRRTYTEAVRDGACTARSAPGMSMSLRSSTPTHAGLRRLVRPRAGHHPHRGTPGEGPAADVNTSAAYLRRLISSSG